MDVVKKIVNSDSCIGCGACVFICPNDVLYLSKSKKSDYIASYDRDCDYQCGACLNVCPFYVRPDFFADCKYIGKYEKIFIGYDENENNRKLSASGGLCTKIAMELLENNYIDGIISVIPTIGYNRLFKYSVITNISDLKESRGSFYYQTEICSVLSEIANSDKKFVITAVPCIATAIKNITIYNKKIRDNIVYIFGLVCGQNKNELFTQYLVDHNINEIINIKYRSKNNIKKVNDFNFEYRYKDEVITRNFKSISNLWTKKAFTPPACLRCDDIFCESSDVTFMDDWTADGKKVLMGRNIIIVRNKELLKFINNIKHINISPVTSEYVINSQRDVIINKRHLIKYYKPELTGCENYVTRNLDNLDKIDLFIKDYIRVFSYKLDINNKKEMTFQLRLLFALSTVFSQLNKIKYKIMRIV